MIGSTIGTTIAVGITLGTTSGPGLYLSPLTITLAGDIAPSANGATGLYAAIAAGYVLNQGTIVGAVGTIGGTLSPGGNGGLGVHLAAGRLVNHGTITGAFGGAGGGGGDGGAGGCGVTLAGGSVANDGAISGGGGGAGSIAGTGGAGGTGVVLAGGSLTNNGSIGGGAGGRSERQGGVGGTGIVLTSGTLVNGGTIDGGSGILGAHGGTGVDLAGGSLTNHGTISGGIGRHIYNFIEGAGGIGVALDAGSLINDNTIIGGSAEQYDNGGDGVAETGGNLLNHGTIIGGTGGAGEVAVGAGGVGVSLAGGSLANDGLITGGKGGFGYPVGGSAGAGVAISAGILTNQGTIVGASGALGFRGYGSGGTGVDLTAGSLINDGTIAGGPGSQSFPDSGDAGTGVLFHGGGTLTDLGIIAGGNRTAGIANAVYFGTGVSRLILQPGATFIGAVVANPGYANVLELATGGPGTIGSLGDTITGFRTIDFDPGATWFVEANQAGLAAGQPIHGFAPGDTLELAGITATGSSYLAGTLTLTEVSGSLELNLPGTFSTGEFVVANVAAGVDISVACFRQGTHIRTRHGDLPVEQLRLGEAVLGHAGDGRPVPRPIVWIGYRSIDCRRHPTPRRVWPVRIRAGAFGLARPARDLYLSPDHAVFVANVMIPVKHLTNGTSIEQVPVDEVTYFHLELPEHSVLLAEGLTTESYLDTGDRANFSNGGQRLTLFPDFATRSWEAAGCAPLVVAGPILDIVRARLNRFAASIGSSRWPTAATA